MTRIPEEDRAKIPGQIAKFRRFHPLMSRGDQYRLGNLFKDDSFDAWVFVSKDKTEALLTYVQILGKPNGIPKRIRVKGLDAAKRYFCEETGQTLSGQTLMSCGIDISLHGDFVSKTFYFKAEEA